MYIFSFIKTFRLSKDAFLHVFNYIKDNLNASHRSTAIPSWLKLTATLKFLGQGVYQHQIVQDRLLGISQLQVVLQKYIK